MEEIKPNLDFYLKNKEFVGERETKVYVKFANYARLGILENLFATQVSDDFITMLRDSENDDKAVNKKTNIAAKKTTHKPGKRELITYTSPPKTALDKTKSDISFISKGIGVYQKTKTVATTLSHAMNATAYVSKITEQAKKLTTTFKGTSFAKKIGDQARKIANSFKNTKLAQKIGSQIQKFVGSAMISKISTKVVSVFKFLGKIGSFLGPLASAIGPVLDIVTSIISIFCPPPDPTKIILEHMDKKFAELNANMQRGFNEINRNLEKGFDRLSEHMEKGFRMIVDKMVAGFQEASVQLENGIEQIQSRINELSTFIGESTLTVINQNYLTTIHAKVNNLVAVYERYSPNPTNNKTREQMHRVCIDNNPESFIKTLQSMITQRYLLSLEKLSSGNFGVISPLLLVISSDLAHINMIAPTCIAISLDPSRQCERTAFLTKATTDLMKLLEYRLRVYDVVQEDIIRNLIKHSIKEKAAEMKRDQSFKSELSQEERIYLAHELVMLFNLKLPSAKFTVFVHAVDEHFESVVSPKYKEKLFRFESYETSLQGLTIVVYWYRKEQQPDNELWVRCINKEASCWMDQKPSCNLMGTSPADDPDKPKVCKDDSECFVRKPGEIPTCGDGQQCYKPCSEVYESSDKFCYENEFGCIVNSNNCIRHGMELLETSEFINSFRAAIDGESCVSYTNDSLAKYFGSGSTPACFTEDSTLKSKNNDTSSLSEFPKAVIFDCVSVFGLPQAVNLAEYHNTNTKPKNSRKKKSSSSDWDFHNIGNLMKQIQDYHEMNSLSFCLLGVTAHYDTDKTITKISFASDMNGVSVSYIPFHAVDDKYYISKVFDEQYSIITGKPYIDREVNEFLEKFYKTMTGTKINELFRQFLNFHNIESNYTFIFELNPKQTVALKVFDAMYDANNFSAAFMKQHASQIKRVTVYPTYVYIVGNCGDEANESILQSQNEDFLSSCKAEVNKANDMVSQLKTTDEHVRTNVEKKRKAEKVKLIMTIFGIVVGVLITIVLAILLGAFVNKKRKTQRGILKKVDKNKGTQDKGHTKLSLASLKKLSKKSISSIKRGKSIGKISKSQKSKGSMKISKLQKSKGSGKISKSQIRKGSILNKVSSIGQVSKQSDKKSSKVPIKRLQPKLGVSATSVKAGSAPVKGKTYTTLQRIASQNKNAPSTGQISKQSEKRSSQNLNKRLQPKKTVSASSLKRGSAPVINKNYAPLQRIASLKKTSSLAKVNSNTKQPHKQQKLLAGSQIKQPGSGKKVWMEKQNILPVKATKLGTKKK